MTQSDQVDLTPHLRKIVKIDPAFAVIIKKAPICNIERKKYTRSHYETIVVSICSQQLSTKAADTIIARVKVAVGGKISPENISNLSNVNLRKCGLSFAKIRCIRELTDAVESKEINFRKITTMSNSEITEKLTAIWGIGRWTVEMFLIFHLGRLDLWPTGDLAVRRGWEIIHKLDKKISPKELEVQGSKFEGFQSIVAWYCWRAVDGDSNNW